MDGTANAAFSMARAQSRPHSGSRSATKRSSLCISRMPWLFMRYNSSSYGICFHAFRAIFYRPPGQLNAEADAPDQPRNKQNNIDDYSFDHDPPSGTATRSPSLKLCLNRAMISCASATDRGSYPRKTIFLSSIYMGNSFGGGFSEI